jgi:hypothetical protein
MVIDLVDLGGPAPAARGPLPGRLLRAKRASIRPTQLSRTSGLDTVFWCSGAEVSGGNCIDNANLRLQPWPTGHPTWRCDAVRSCFMVSPDLTSVRNRPGSARSAVRPGCAVPERQTLERWRRAARPEPGILVWLTPCEREPSNVRFLGLMAYLVSERIVGDQSMPGRQWSRPGVRM